MLVIKVLWKNLLEGMYVPGSNKSGKTWEDFFDIVPVFAILQGGLLSALTNRDGQSERLWGGL
jgi:hypothetical protein